MDDNDKLRQIRWADQFQAASEQARGIAEDMSTLADALGLERPGRAVNKRFTSTYLGSKFAWLQDWDAYQQAKLKRCDHVDIDNPRVWFVHLFNPNVVLCHDCSPKIARDYYQLNPSDCDFCQVNVPSNHFHEISVQIGSFILFGNICDSCNNLQSASE